MDESLSVREVPTSFVYPENCQFLVILGIRGRSVIGALARWTKIYRYVQCRSHTTNKMFIRRLINDAVCAFH